MKLNETERPSYGREVEVSSSSPSMRTGGKSGLRLREMTTCVVLLWLNETRLSLPNFSITVEMFVNRY